MHRDPLVEEIHEIRRKRAEKYRYDIDAMYEAIKDSERKSNRQFVSFPPKRIKPELDKLRQ